MITLGIESTAHTFGIGIIKDEKGKINVFCNLRDMYKTEKGGIIPIESAKHHKEVADKLYQDALQQSKINEKDINIIAYSAAPGLPPCLKEGKEFAKKLAMKLNRSLVPVNHCIAHLEIGRTLTKAKDPVLLYCSGANTQVIVFTERKYRIFGETLDQGIGNFIDAFGRYIGFGFPAGPEIEEMASHGKNFIKLPYSIKGMDVAFAGLLTNLKQKFDSKRYSIEDLCYSMQETAFAMLIETAERALSHCQKKELLLGGGVACNKRLQEMAKIMCKERNAKCFILENQYNVDNAVMIADLGLKMFKAGIFVKPEQAEIFPYERTDDVKVKWR
ncbi:UGMP family protein [Candidatus Pacearchaeota archaeon CG_4_9_14_3_um_filter_31_7]|nr:MAG: UGMP family protein [Candidatus Pacearchaeota archaeon CG1_02_31_27]PIN92061.1 MAG: UGMP family protein [Candidatus Pacearchaeota archaeon CG10_big_fil_rev_8_21_14_0_10_31_59]PJA70767.1 MAG: UGMP family protein [Candidatus Pacearchaeota archaeon CG_4_9_14_3_um_filter_31_7]